MGNVEFIIVCPRCRYYTRLSRFNISVECVPDKNLVKIELTCPKCGFNQSFEV